MGEFLFIFWPTAKSVKATLLDLLSAEKKAKKMAFDADELSISREKSIKELRALSHAMDVRPLRNFHASNGNLIHMGNNNLAYLNFLNLKKKYYFGMF